MLLGPMYAIAVKELNMGRGRFWARAAAAGCSAAVVAACGSLKPAPPPLRSATVAAPPVTHRVASEGWSGGILATVNGKPITDYELEQRLPPPFRDPAKRDDPRVAEMRLLTLRNLAQRRVMADAAMVEHIEVTEQDVDDAITRDRLHLKLSPEAYKQYVETNYGCSYDEYRDRMKEDILIHELEGRRLVGKLYVTPQQLREQYWNNPATYEEEETVNFQCIQLVPARGEGKDETKAKADALRRQLAAGADFDAMARVYDFSHDGRVRENVGRGRLPEAVERELFKLPIGRVSDVLPFDPGFAICRVTDRRLRRMKPFEDRALQIGILQEKRFATLNELQRSVLREYLPSASIDPPDLFPPGYPDTR